jgi:cell division protein FtsB|tara:strand:- start:1073 stop:1561 length:489 start_codon:yes stop_codon:yes gene_type:complete
MGLKLALIMLIVTGVMGSGFYWYYQDSQAKLAILHENNAKLETAVVSQKEAIQQLEDDVEFAASIAKTTSVSLEAARKQVSVIERKFNKTSKLLGERSIGKLALAKPRPVRKIINKGTNDVFRCFEIISGSILTEKELNAEKKSQTNTNCPGIANPKYIIPD